jgi:hypothetical protein
VVTEDNGPGTYLSGNPGKEFVANFASGHFEGHVLRVRYPTDIHSLSVTRDSQTTTRFGHEPGVLCAPSSQAMVQVSHFQLPPGLRSQLRVNLQQHHGIDPPGNAEEKAVSPLEKLMALNGFQNCLLHRFRQFLREVITPDHRTHSGPCHAQWGVTAWEFSLNFARACWTDKTSLEDRLSFPLEAVETSVAVSVS